ESRVPRRPTIHRRRLPRRRTRPNLRTLPHLHRLPRLRLNRETRWRFLGWPTLERKRLMYMLDLGIRCDRHIGEAVPVKCAACDTLSAEYGSMGMRASWLCRNHPAHLRPCEKGCDD